MLCPSSCCGVQKGKIQSRYRRFLVGKTVDDELSSKGDTVTPEGAALAGVTPYIP